MGLGEVHSHDDVELRVGPPVAVHGRDGARENEGELSKAKECAGGRKRGAPLTKEVEGDAGFPGDVGECEVTPGSQTVGGKG
jgi:hypothetical protein